MSAAPSEATQTRRAVKNILKGSAGNLVEWYDLYVYTVFAAYIQSHFFSSESDLQAGLEAMAVFSTTFLMRPIGAWFFGRYADRKGRKAALTLSVTMMSAGSFAIAVLPTKDVLGVWALIILVLIRLVQGFSVGGEYGTSATYMSEAATARRRGFFSSFQYVTLVGGQMLALLVLIVLQNTMASEILTEWGWRIPFAIGGVAALVVLWLRRSMEETLSSDQLRAAHVKVPGEAQPGTMRLLFTQHFRPLLICIGVTLGGTVAFYTYTNFILKFMNDTSGIAKTDTSVINFWALFIFMCLQPVYGIISDKVGRKPLLLWFGITGVLFTWPLLSALGGTRDPFTAFLLMLGGLLIVGGYTSINALVKAELFPASIRALGVGLGYAIANSLFGGTVPLIGAALQKAGNIELFFTYVTVAIGLSLLVYIFALKNKKPTQLDAEQGAAWASASGPSDGAADHGGGGNQDRDRDLSEGSRR
ncbi:MFS transporter [Pseudarthrobacter sp. PS3-L1]|uniref:MFS transporter n=1 Tax=Pseudarthrobacter sp. PS3-L1 TaxID=3046207 RepID=UPI0024B96D9A|nr:MFS transporter [Pseudarthrobacter sp. PS3-L1]MDJ0320539.1 MFS transporter [Pseudarthrobacter sp. PS3-L1]